MASAYREIQAQLGSLQARRRIVRQEVITAAIIELGEVLLSEIRSLIRSVEQMRLRMTKRHHSDVSAGIVAVKGIPEALARTSRSKSKKAKSCRNHECVRPFKCSLMATDSEHAGRFNGSDDVVYPRSQNSR